jgi:hypothetical protein
MVPYKYQDMVASRDRSIVVPNPVRKLMKDANVDN